MNRNPRNTTNIRTIGKLQENTHKTNTNKTNTNKTKTNKTTNINVNKEHINEKHITEIESNLDKSISNYTNTLQFLLNADIKNCVDTTPENIKKCKEELYNRNIFYGDYLLQNMKLFKKYKKIVVKNLINFYKIKDKFKKTKKYVVKKIIPTIAKVTKSVAKSVGKAGESLLHGFAYHTNKSSIGMGMQRMHGGSIEEISQDLSTKQNGNYELQSSYDLLNEEISKGDVSIDEEIDCNKYDKNKNNKNTYKLFCKLEDLNCNKYYKDYSKGKISRNVYSLFCKISNKLENYSNFISAITTLGEMVVKSMHLPLLDISVAFTIKLFSIMHIGFRLLYADISILKNYNEEDINDEQIYYIQDMLKLLVNYGIIDKNSNVFKTAIPELLAEPDYKHTYRNHNIPKPNKKTHFREYELWKNAKKEKEKYILLKKINRITKFKIISMLIKDILIFRVEFSDIINEIIDSNINKYIMYDCFKVEVIKKIDDSVYNNIIALINDNEGELKKISDENIIDIIVNLRQLITNCINGKIDNRNHSDNVTKEETKEKTILENKYKFQAKVLMDLYKILLDSNTKQNIYTQTTEAIEILTKDEFYKKLNNYILLYMQLYLKKILLTKLNNTGTKIYDVDIKYDIFKTYIENIEKADKMHNMNILKQLINVREDFIDKDFKDCEDTYNNSFQTCSDKNQFQFKLHLLDKVNDTTKNNSRKLISNFVKEHTPSDNNPKLSKLLTNIYKTKRHAFKCKNWNETNKSTQSDTNSKISRVPPRSTKVRQYFANNSSELANPTNLYRKSLFNYGNNNNNNSASMESKSLSNTLRQPTEANEANVLLNNNKNNVELSSIMQQNNKAFNSNSNSNSNYESIRSTSTVNNLQNEDNEHNEHNNLPTKTNSSVLLIQNNKRHNIATYNTKTNEVTL